MGRQPAAKVAAHIAAVLDAARSGVVPLSALGEAYDLAVKYDLPAARAEVSSHIRDIVDPPKWFGSGLARTAGLSVGFGIVAGIATHFLLVGAGQVRPPISSPKRRYVLA